MKHHGVLFKGEMIKALLDGRKTQTRRIVKFPVIDRFGSGDELSVLAINELLEHGLPISPRVMSVGQLIYAKETFAYHICANKDAEQIHFHADGKCCPNDGERLKWKSSLFMSKRLSRIWLEVTAVRCERVQDITEADALAEGITWPDRNGQPYRPPIDLSGMSTLNLAAERYAELWNTINTAPGTTWEANPFVWVYEFKRTERPQL